MAKITKRGELAKLARELNLLQSPTDHRRLMQTIDDAEATADPAKYLRDLASKQAGSATPPAPPAVAAAAPVVAESEDWQDKAADAAAQLQAGSAAARKQPDVMVSLPDLSAPRPGFVKDHFQLSLIRKPLARATLHRLTKELNERNARLANGHHVGKYSEAVQWLLEEYGRATGVEV